MSTRSQAAQSSDSSGASAESHASLQRGRACLTCRRRKLKCDGGRPVCQQCIRSHLQNDCEYADSQGRTRTQMLEDEVARLQAVIQELENPASAAGNITLHNPYFGGSSGQGRSSGVVAPVISRTSSNNGGANGSWWELGHPPKHIVEKLVQRFLAHAQQLGFSLNISRFLASIAAGPGNHNGPHPALLNAVLLWSTHLTSSENSEAQQQALLSRAVSGLTDALGSADPRKRIQALQAEVLLALYFFCTGRFLEGKYHSNAAVSLALGCGLHTIRSSQTPGNIQTANLSPSALLNGGALGSSSVFAMAPASDMVEEGERINIFWAVFNIDRCWSVATGSPTMLYDDISLGTRIDSPWPLPMEVYEQMNQQSTATFSRTVQRFLSGEPGQSPQNEASAVALRAKASALFYEATRLAASWTPAKSQNVIPDMQRLHHVISKFIRSLMPLQEAEKRSHELSRQMMTVHTLAHGSMLQLHNVRAEVDADAAKFCMSHATEIARLLDHIISDHDGKLDYIVGTVWVAAAHVFTRERSALLASQVNTSSVATKSACEANITRVVTALSNLTACPVLRYQAAKIQGSLQT